MLHIEYKIFLKKKKMNLMIQTQGAGYLKSLYRCFTPEWLGGEKA